MATIGILALGWTLLLFHLDTVPPGFQHDETFNVLDAIEVVYKNFHLYFPKNFGREPVFFYTAAIIYRYLIGIHWVWGLRFAGIIWAMPGIAASLALAKRYVTPPYAIFSGALLVTSFWFLFVARVGLRAITLFPVATVAFYLLLRGFESRSLRYLIPMGIMAGLATYTYLPGRFLPFIVLVIILFEFAIMQFSRESNSLTVKQLAVTIIVMFLVAGPMYLYIFKHPELVNQRINELNAPLEEALKGNLSALLRIGLATVQTLLYQNKDALPYHYSLPDRPVLQPILTLLFLSGVVASVVRFSERKMRLLLVWLVIGFIPNMVTIGGPIFLRAIIALPVVFILIAIGAMAIMQLASKFSQPSRRRWAQMLVGGILITGLLGHSFKDVSAYFVVWARADETQSTYRSDLRRIASYLDSIPAETPIYISSSFWLDLDQQTYLLYNPQKRDVGWFNAQLGLPWPAENAIVTVFSSSSRPNPILQCVLDRMQLLEIEMTPSGQETLFESYMMPPIDEDDLPCQLRHVYHPTNFSSTLQIDSAVIRTESGGAVIMTLWTVLDYWPHTTPPKISVRMKDDNGSLLAQKDELLAVAYQHWRPGDRFLQVTHIPNIDKIPEDVTLSLVIYNAQGALTATVDGTEVGEEAPIILQPEE